MLNLLSSFEIIANRLLRLDPIAEKSVLQLDGKSIAFRATTPPFSATLLFTDGRIALLASDTPQASVRIEGPLHKIVMLALSKTETLVAEGVRIRGEQTLLLELKHLMHQLDIDWEEPLSHFIGDLAAHKVGHWTHNLWLWSKRAASALAETGEHFITHDFQETIRPEEIDAYLNQVDRLNAGVERIQMRIAKLEQQFATHTDTKKTKIKDTKQDLSC